MPADTTITELTLDRIRTPIGALLVVCDAEGRLRAAEFADHEERMQRSLRLGAAAINDFVVPRKGRSPTAVRDGLEAYFDGKLDAINRIAVATCGSDFQEKVWRALRGVTAGSTLTYAAFAKRIGKASAIRAVGAANGANPVSVIVPCHRLVGSNGDLTGYGGGIERKRWLLRHEGAEI